MLLFRDLFYFKYTFNKLCYNSAQGTVDLDDQYCVSLFLTCVYF